MDVKRTPSEEQILISVTRDWLERLNNAEMTLHNGMKVKVGWIEPLVDQGVYRLQFVPLGLEWVIVNAVDSEYFSKS